MSKISNENFIEKRSYIRIRVPLELSYTVCRDSEIRRVSTKDISANGLRFQNLDKAIDKADTIEMKLVLPNAVNPIHAKGTVIWKKSLSLEDKAPFDTGIAFSEIEEDNKNTFLKFLCDYIYKLSEEN